MLSNTDWNDIKVRLVDLFPAAKMNDHQLDVWLDALDKYKPETILKALERLYTKQQRNTPYLHELLAIIETLSVADCESRYWTTEQVLRNRWCAEHPTDAEYYKSLTDGQIFCLHCWQLLRYATRVYLPMRHPKAVDAFKKQYIDSAKRIGITVDIGAELIDPRLLWEGYE